MNPPTSVPSADPAADPVIFVKAIESPTTRNGAHRSPIAVVTISPSA